MNQPIEQRLEKIEQRLDSLEQDRDGMIENEKMLVRLSQKHNLNLEEVKAIVRRIELDIGDTRERFDTIERTQSEHGALFKSHVAGSRERFDTIERTQSNHGELLKEILQLLKPGGE